MSVAEMVLETIQALPAEQQEQVLKYAQDLQKNQALGVSTYDGSIDLAERGIDAEQAADLRSRLQTFAEDWDSPEMKAYDEI